MMKPGIFIIACLTCLAGNVLADTIQSHTSIQKAAENFMMEKVQATNGREADVKAGHLDSRLRLGECDAPLETFQPDGGRTLGNTTVGVRCAGSKPWTLYVPVKVSIYESVVVAARPLQKGKQLEQQDLKLVDRDLAALRSGYYRSIHDVLGKQISRTVNMGVAITSLMVKDLKQVKRGQTINLIAKAGGLHVQMKGKALADGSTGERIQVRNLSTERVIEGIVSSATTVLVNM
jgi:flagella basal body P-ring formation protein FlgA